MRWWYDGGNGGGGSGNTGGNSGGGGSSEPPCDASCLAIGATGPGGGKIVYHKHSGFTVTGTDSFTAFYLEAAPSNYESKEQWVQAAYWNVDIEGTSTAIGTGKANTAAILAIDSNSRAALVCKKYTTYGDLDDWFLPSKDELIEMYKANIGMSSSSGYWSSSQYSKSNAWSQWSKYDYDSSTQLKSKQFYIRAIRAF